MTSEQTPTPLILSVLMPVRNEGVNIKIMLKILTAAIEVPHEILIVYDQPDDDCIEVVGQLEDQHPNVRLVYNQLGVGVVNAIKAGVEVAQGEIVLIFAVDEIGPVLAIDDMLHLIEKEGCDLVSCTRYAHGGRRLGGSRVGHVLSWIANRAYFSLFNTALTDCTTGIKMFRKTILDDIKLEANPIGWAVAFELSIKAQFQGLKIGEVPIISIDRLFGGESTFKLGPWFIEYFRWFVWGAKNLKKHKTRHAIVRKPN